jgi:hypothetical protein
VPSKPALRSLSWGRAARPAATLFGRPICGEFDVARTVVASEQLQVLALEQRLDVLDKARRSAELGARRMITPYLPAQGGRVRGFARHRGKRCG